ncbi:unnamed protein product, partial [Ilex paraguariensis]
MLVEVFYMSKRLGPSFRNLFIVDSPLYLEIGQCINGVYTANSSFSSSSRIHSYVNVSGLRAVEVRERCNIELMVMTSWPFKDDNNISFSDIYDAIEYGFELSWFKTQCENCELGYCFHRGDNQKLCTSYCSFLGMIVPFSPELLMLSTKC